MLILDCILNTFLFLMQNEHDKIRELSQQLAVEKKRAATYKRHLDLIFEHIEEHNESLSKKIQHIVDSVKEIESKEQQVYRQSAFGNIKHLLFCEAQNQAMLWRMLQDEADCFGFSVGLRYLVLHLGLGNQLVLQFGMFQSMAFIGLLCIMCCLQQMFPTANVCRKFVESMYSLPGPSLSKCLTMQ